MKFDMGSQTLSNLVKQTQGSNDDLGVLVKQLIAAAQPLEGKFNGAGKAAFDSFKAHSDQITADLNSALASIVGGQKGMDGAFRTGDTEMHDTARSTMGAANFDAARFSGHWESGEIIRANAGRRSYDTGASAEAQTNLAGVISRL